MVEIVLRDEGADIIGGFPLWANVEITDEEGGFLKVDEMCCSEKRLLLGATYCDVLPLLLHDAAIAPAGKVYHFGAGQDHF